MTVNKKCLLAIYTHRRYVPTLPCDNDLQKGQRSHIIHPHNLGVSYTIGERWRELGGKEGGVYLYNGKEGPYFGCWT